MPESLLKRLLQYIGAGAIIIVFSIFLMIFFRTWQYCLGFLIALYIIYLGLDIAWGFYDGKIICSKMVCIKATVLPGKKRLFIIMRDLNAKDVDINNTHKFYIASSKKNISLITPQTIMEVYYRPDNPMEMVAWNILGSEI